MTETPTVEFVGSPCGQHGPYTFYKSFKYLRNGKYKQLSLGEFFFVQISEDVPLGIGELQLLWEDKNADCTHLTSVRLYFLPEHTPEGKQEYHGEDEVLAENNKVVMRVEDLLDWIVEDASWTYGMKAVTTPEPPPLKAEHDSNNKVNHEHAKHCLPNHANSHLRNSKCARAAKDVSNNHKKCSANKHEKGTNGLWNDVIVLSFSQYCRYRAVLKRLENVTDIWLRNVLVCAIGGFTVTQPNTRILFCRDTTEHPLLEDHDCRLDHLAPNLKGRPRKKKLKFKRETSVESDSNESEGGASDKMTPEKERPVNNIIKNQHNLLSSKHKDRVTLNEKKFMTAINDYMNKRGTPIGRIPSLGFKQLDLYQMYLISQKLGGYEQITEKRLWKIIYDKLGGNPGSTSAATCTRRHYEKLLLPFERYMKNELHKPFPKPYVRVRGKSRNGSDLDRGSLNGEQKDDDDISDEDEMSPDTEESKENEKKKEVPSKRREIKKEKKLEEKIKKEVKNEVKKEVKTEVKTEVKSESSSNDIKPPPPLTPASSQNGAVPPSGGDPLKPAVTSAAPVHSVDSMDKENSLMNLSSLTSIRCPVDQGDVPLPPAMAAMVQRKDGLPRGAGLPLALPLPPPLRPGFPPALLPGLARLPVPHPVPGKSLPPMSSAHVASLPPSSVASLNRTVREWVSNNGRASVIQHTPPGGSSNKLPEPPGGHKPRPGQTPPTPYLLPGQYPPLPPKPGKRPYPFDRTPPPAHSYRTPTAQLLRDFDPKRPRLVMEEGSILDQHMRRMQRIGQGKEELPTDLSRRPTLAIPRPPPPVALTSHPLSLAQRADTPSRIGAPHLRHLTPPRPPLSAHTPSPSPRPSSTHSSPRAPPPAAHGHSSSYPSPSTPRSVSSSPTVDLRRASPLVGGLPSGLSPLLATSPHLLSPVLGLLPRAMANAVSPHNMPKPALVSPSPRTDKLSPRASEKPAVPASLSPSFRPPLSDAPTYIPSLASSLAAAKEAKDIGSTASSQATSSLAMTLTSSSASLSSSLSSIQAAAAAAGAAGRLLPVSLPDGQVILHPAFPQFTTVLPGGVIPSGVDPRLLFDSQSLGSSSSSSSAAVKDSRDGSAASTAASVTLPYTPSLYLNRK